jgi:hypothetical protein
MKNYLTSALVIFIVAAFTDVQAQIEPGYIIGLNLSSFTLKTNNSTTRSESLTGVHFGGIFEIPLTDNFTLRPGIILSAKGSNFKIDTTDLSLSPIYFEIPFQVACSFGSEVIKISLFTGPYLACGIGGYKIESGGEMKSINFGSGDDNDLKHFDAGLDFGAAVKIRGLMISAQYEIGLANILPAPKADTEMKNNVIGISISSLFPER